MRDVARYLRSNPQVLVLLVICLVLGLGMFLAVVISLATSSGTTTGEPSGSLGVLHAAVGAWRAL
jgi:hypothetical protein